jgi:hypothetical protein
VRADVLADPAHRVDDRHPRARGAGDLIALIAGFNVKLAREGGRSIQASTGMFYLAVILAPAVEFAAKVRFFYGLEGIGRQTVCVHVGFDRGQHPSVRQFGQQPGTGHATSSADLDHRAGAHRAGCPPQQRSDLRRWRRQGAARRRAVTVASGSGARTRRTSCSTASSTMVARLVATVLATTAVARWSSCRQPSPVAGQPVGPARAVSARHTGSGDASPHLAGSRHRTLDADAAP